VRVYCKSHRFQAILIYLAYVLLGLERMGFESRGHTFQAILIYLAFVLLGLERMGFEVLGVGMGQDFGLEVVSRS